MKLLETTDFSFDALESSSSDPNLYAMKLIFKDRSIFLGPSPAEEFPLAVLNEETSKAIQELSQLDSCQFSVWLNRKSWEALLKKEAKTNKIILPLVDIVVCGLRVIRNSVGDLLATSHIYLQHPCHKEAEIIYDNPHFLEFKDSTPGSGMISTSNAQDMPTTRFGAIIAYDSKPQEISPETQLHHKVAEVFSSLTRFKHLTRLEADIRITARLMP